MLINFWSDANKVTHCGLQVQWTMTQVGYVSGNPWYEFHRIATKSYSYVGMNETTARACVDAKQAQYTRTFTQWYTERGAMYKPTKISKCVANVVLRHDAGNMWSVDIDVNEDQIQYYWEAGSFHVGLFDLTMDYDESPTVGDYLRISNTWRELNRLYVQYQQSISGFDRTSPKFVVQNSTDGGSTWTAITPTSSTDGQMYFNNGVWSAGLVRVLWDGMASNVVATPTSQYSNTITLRNPYLQPVGTDEWVWETIALPDFANFDPSAIYVLSRSTSAGSMANITSQCFIDGTIIQPPGSPGDVFQLQLQYKGIYSNIVSTAAFYITVAASATATVDTTVVDVVSVGITQTLDEGFDATKLTVSYSDNYGSGEYLNSALTITGDGESRTISFNVGHSIPADGLSLSAAVKYDGVIVGTATAKVYRS